MQEKFKTQWGLIFSVLGMAIGAGNIWRFPRLVGKYGNSFMILYIIFNLTWAIPLLMAEFSLGRSTGKGIIGSITKLTSRKNGWLAAFIALCSTAILFYYSVVTGWTLKYFFITLSPEFKFTIFDRYWADYSVSKWQPLLFHFISVILVTMIIIKGVTAGIERINKIILPVLFALLFIAAVYATTLPGAEAGLTYLFSFNAEHLLDPTMWIEALSQIAWSTGAGWGLVLTYAAYMKKEESIVTTSVLTVIGNGTASLLAATAIIPTLFSLAPSVQDALTELAKGNQGLTFIVLPSLFQQLPAGKIIAPVFFAALFLAAISSMISLFEMLTKIFIDRGFNRKKSALTVAVLTALFGIPSAVSMGFFNNQDWVWGLGLLIGGLLIAVFTIKWGIGNFIGETGLQGSVWTKIFRFVFTVLIPAQFVIMLGFWSYKTVAGNLDWWQPFRSFSLGTCIMQWVAGLLILHVFNDKLSVSEN